MKAVPSIVQVAKPVVPYSHLQGPLQHERIEAALKIFAAVFMQQTWIFREGMTRGECSALWISGFGAYVLETNSDYNSFFLRARGLHGWRLFLLDQGLGFRVRD